ncbi:PREDICTED: glutathione S-transferase T3-like [Brassica oleracea var. oleracea]|uniref:glutathione S-transferase T3-like n=1 Tax=Brassica oleracea var. oleracea TaxID=109376 RepID=UPI0006A6EB66|nr:PREDICTED: glutathione S-transferase T3-like [Brassica oleracea var. oleracea]
MNDWACLSVALLDGDGSMYEYLSSNRKTMKAKRHEEDSLDKGVQCNRDCVDIPSSQDTPAKGKERRAWTPTDDLVLISSWLNTSKDPLVGHEQKSAAFWTRIAAYFSASPKLAGCEKREAAQCKHRWQKINDLVCTFCGAYEAAMREKTSGQNGNDVLKQAYEIFFNNHNKNFTLEHAWKELRNDHKWCDVATSKKDGNCKRRKCEDGSHTGSSHAIGTKTGEEDQVTKRPIGVKAAKPVVRRRW